MSYSSEPQVFQKLKNSIQQSYADIQRLKGEKNELNNDMIIDKNDLNNVQNAMGSLNQEIEAKTLIVRQKERKLMELEKAINETEKSYEIIVDTTNKLATALETESLHLKTMTKKM